MDEFLFRAALYRSIEVNLYKLKKRRVFGAHIVGGNYAGEFDRNFAPGDGAGTMERTYAKENAERK
jgi:hypothetical protein